MESKTFFSTDMVEDKLRGEVWRSLLRPLYELLVDRDDPNYQLSGSVAARTSGSVQIWQSSFNTQKYTRTPRIIARSGLDNYLLQIVVDGDLYGDFNGVDVIARPGDIVLIDLAKPIRCKSLAGSRITLMIPREPLEKMIGWPDLHGRVLRRGASMTRLLRSLIEGLYSTVGGLTETEASGVQETLLFLLHGGLTGAQDSHLEDLPISQPMRNRILDYINENLTDPLLSPQSILQRFHVSRSHLYRAFEADGGIAKIIREKRLDRAYRFLLTQPGKPVSFKEVAYYCGFRNGAQFNKAFRTRFDMSPKDIQTIGASQFLPDPAGFSYQEYISAVASTGLVQSRSEKFGHFDIEIRRQVRA